MAWSPVVVGVDPSPASAAAARLGWRIARAANTACHLVHVSDALSRPAAPGPLPDVPSLDMPRLYELVSETLHAALAGSVPQDALEHLELRFGNPVWSLKQAVREHAAGLLVLGGRRPAARQALHSKIVDGAVRVIDVPILVTWAPRPTIRRVLACLDVSDAAQPTFVLAREFAQLLSAELSVVHVVEPDPLDRERPDRADARAYWDAVTATLDWLSPGLADATTRVRIRYGPVGVEIAGEAAASDADLVVLGSHGGDRADRVLIGTATEQLLSWLPTSLLIAPVWEGASPASAGRDDRSAPEAVVAR